MVNMERLRWLPAHPPERAILVNIPEFRLRVVEEGRTTLAMDVVVGTTVRRTLIFRGELKQLVFAPYWNIPERIVEEEIGPQSKVCAVYVNRPFTTCAAFVYGCACTLPGKVCSTSQPSAFKRSAMSERWHCHQSTSAHISAVRCASAISFTCSGAAVNAGVSIWSAYPRRPLLPHAVWGEPSRGVRRPPRSRRCT